MKLSLRTFRIHIQTQPVLTTWSVTYLTTFRRFIDILPALEVTRISAGEKNLTRNIEDKTVTHDSA